MYEPYDCQVYPNTLVPDPTNANARRRSADDGKLETLLIHASASTHQHGKLPTAAGNWSSLLTFRTRKDGFIFGAIPPQNCKQTNADHTPTATFLTQKLVWTGGELYLNADLADSRGTIPHSEDLPMTIAIVDGSSGALVPGYEMNLPLAGNSTSMQVEWPNATMDALHGKTIQVKGVFGCGTKLYSLRGNFSFVFV